MPADFILAVLDGETVPPPFELHSMPKGSTSVASAPHVKTEPLQEKFHADQPYACNRNYTPPRRYHNSLAPMQEVISGTHNQFAGIPNSWRNSISSIDTHRAD